MYVVLYGTYCLHVYIFVMLYSRPQSRVYGTHPSEPRAMHEGVIVVYQSVCNFFEIISMFHFFSQTWKKQFLEIVCHMYLFYSCFLFCVLLEKYYHKHKTKRATTYHQHPNALSVLDVFTMRIILLYNYFRNTNT